MPGVCVCVGLVAVLLCVALLIFAGKSYTFRTKFRFSLLRKQTCETRDSIVMLVAGRLEGFRGFATVRMTYFPRLKTLSCLIRPLLAVFVLNAVGH